MPLLLSECIPESAEQIRKFLVRHALPERYILFVGSCDPRKNLTLIPEAIEKSGTHLPLVVIGWSGQKSRKKALIPPG